jgi:predicted enzyme related to lactoylglutathione lyase
MVSMQSIALASEHPEVLAEFYRKILGKPGWDDGSFSGWKVGSNFLMVGGHSEVTGVNASPARIMIGFMTDDVKEEFARMTELGATVVAEPYHPDPEGKVTLATLADPDGNYFQLMTPWEETVTP